MSRNGWEGVEGKLKKDYFSTVQAGWTFWFPGNISRTFIQSLYNKPFASFVFDIWIYTDGSSSNFRTNGFPVLEYLHFVESKPQIQPRLD